MMKRRNFLKLSLFGGGLALAASYPFFIERNIVLVNKYRIYLERLPAVFDGFTIVHLTDLHYGPLVSYRLVKKVLGRANSIPRDVIVCTGDYVHERDAAKQIDKVWPLLSNLKAPYGVYSVLGNHDHWADTGRSLWWLEKSGQSIRHKVKFLERHGQKLWFAGAGDLWEDHISIDKLVADIPENDRTIVLAHNPDSADTVNTDSKIDLFISGHTHGGQINIPFIGTPVLPVKNYTYSSGLKKSTNGTPVFISKGIGWALYPVRFNCYPEIAVISLKSGKKFI